MVWRMNPTSLKPFGIRVATGTSRSNKQAPGRQFPAFYKLCSNVAAELSRDYVVEFTAFTVIAAISAWPIVSCIVAISHMLRFS